MNVPVKTHDDDDHRSRRYDIGPVVYDDIASCDFKRDHGSLEDEKVPARSETHGIIHVATSEADEG